MNKPVSVWSDHRATLGEGIIWDGRRDRLFWVDIKEARLFETLPHEPGTQEWTIVGDVGGSIGCIAVDPNSDGFLAATGRGIVRLRCDDLARTAKLEVLAAAPETEWPGNRFNDGAIDPLGGFWAGTMDNKEERVSGAWWRWDGHDLLQMATGFKVTNGPVFIPLRDRTFKVFLTDSAAAAIYVGKFTPQKGLRELEVWARFDPREGYPDGMCLDHHGRMWISFWDGAAIRAYDPLQRKCGNAVAEVQLPVRRPTKLAFTPEGSCFVTSAAVGLTEKTSDNLIDGALIKISNLHPAFRTGPDQDN